MNNRSLGLDSECDLAVEAESEEATAAIAKLRTRLMAEHLGATEEEVARTFDATGSLLRTIEQLQRPGKTLALLPIEEPAPAAKAVADRELLDPKSPDVMFEQMTRRSLFDSFRRRFRQREAARA
jgi:hypothetical protein